MSKTLTSLDPPLCQAATCDCINVKQSGVKKAENLKTFPGFKNETSNTT